MVDKHGVRTDPDRCGGGCFGMKGTQNGHAADEFSRICKLLSRFHETIRRQSLPDAAADAQQRKEIKKE